MKLALILILLICLFVILGVLAYSLTRRDRLSNLYFVVFTSGVGLYTAGYLLQILCTTQEAAVVALKIQNLGIPAIAPFFLLFVLSVCAVKYLHRWMAYVAFGYSMAVFLVVLSNEYHRLFYTEIAFFAHGDLFYLQVTDGPLRRLFQLTTLLCVAVSLCVLILRIFTWQSKRRMRLYILLAGCVISTLAEVLSEAGFTGYVEISPVALTFMSFLCLFSLVRFKLYDMHDIAPMSVLRSMGAAVVVLDMDWCYRLSNPSAQTLFPDLKVLLESEEIAAVSGWPEQLRLNPGETQVEFFRGEGESRLCMRADVAPITENKIAIGWLVVMVDITEHTNLLQRLNTLATTDELTGIYNRRYFLEAAQRQMELAKREKTISAMVIFDIDHFKDINDKYGHLAGDLVLRKLCDTVRAELRPYDIFARYGGEEFAVMILNIALEDAAKFTRRLCEAVARMRIEYGTYKIQVTASFGLVSVSSSDRLEDAISCADRAMYAAKEGGRNRVVVGAIDRCGAVDTTKAAQM